MTQLLIQQLRIREYYTICSTSILLFLGSPTGVQISHLNN